MTTPIVSIVAKSGTGKTTLLEKLIAELKTRGYRVGALKHDAHKFNIDLKGKDSWRLTQAGADTTIITSPAKLAVVKKHADEKKPAVLEIAETYFNDVDIILTEGFKNSRFPKIEVHRQDRSPTLMCRGENEDSTLVAVASDSNLRLDVPLFHIDDAFRICNFIVERFLS